jgi:hypothetical protein
LVQFCFPRRIDPHARHNHYYYECDRRSIAFRIHQPARNSESEVKIEFDDAPKPISSPVCMFAITLKPEDHCDASFLAPADLPSPVVADPARMGDDGKLAPQGGLKRGAAIGCVV